MTFCYCHCYFRISRIFLLLSRRAVGGGGQEEHSVIKWRWWSIRVKVISSISDLDNTFFFAYFIFLPIYILINLHNFLFWKFPNLQKNCTTNTINICIQQVLTSCHICFTYPASVCVCTIFAKPSKSYINHDNVNVNTSLYISKECLPIFYILIIFKELFLILK